MIAIIGVMSILVGSFQAFHQRYLRRMLAYSGVVNAGYAILLFPLGYMAFDSLIFYLFVYGLALVGLFAYAQFSVSVLKEEEKSDLALDHMATARKMIPKFLIGLAVICFFSLAGLPPFPGFFAKYLVIADLWKAEHYFSMTLVLLGSLLGLGYYLGAIGELSFGKSDVKAKEQLVRAPITSYALIGLVLTALFIASYFLI